MIHEYALDPAILSLWASNSRDYAEFMREYGLGTPRIISSFPKKKASKLRSYFLKKEPVDNESLQSQRYVEMVQKMVEVLIIRDGLAVQDSDWEVNAKVENERVPFSVVLSREAIDTVRNITPDNMYLPDSIWNHSSQKNFQRTIDEFHRVVTNFLRFATDKVVIVDPFGWTSEAIATVQHLINSICDERVNTEKPSFYIYFKDKDKSPPAETVKQRIMDGVNNDLSDINLEVFALREVEGNDVFHNRCILTEHGGIITGHGIGVSNDKSHTDEAFLMVPEIYEKKWRQFVEDNRFEIVSHAGS